jgi:hypothetical protein
MSPKFLTTLVTLSLQLWNSTGSGIALEIAHEATWGAEELYHPPKGHE